MSVLVHSFAVFDTCLARLYVRETDLLFALAARILPGPASREDLHEFVRLRLMAEKKARKDLGLEAAGLGLVYERFPRENPWGLAPDLALASELDLVAHSVSPVPPVLKQVRRLIGQGERVVYITDSILPGPALRRLMEANGFAGEIYSAGETGKTKASGQLFSLVLAAEGLEPGQLAHAGPDPAADCKRPRSMGIHTRFNARVALTSHEQHLLRLHRDCAPALSRSVAASRLARLRDDSEAGFDGLRALAADVAAPVLTAFVAWALDEAARAGLERLYFLAREGQILYRLARVLSPAVNGPEPRYLMGSLACWMAPGLAGLDREGFDWLAAAGQSRRPVDLLAKLSLTPEELLQAVGKSMPALLSDHALDDAGLAQLWALLEDGGARRLLAGKAAHSRELMLAYLEQEGALAGPVLAVADMGWTLTTQKALRDVLAGRGVDVSGYYFGLTGVRLGRMEAGAHRALFIERAAQAVPGSLDSLLFRHVPLLERAFTRGDHGRVLGYERKGGEVAPVLGPVPPGAQQTSEVQETVLAYAESLVRSGWGEDTVAALRETAVESLRRFLATPEPGQARAVAALPGQDERDRPLLRRLGVLDVMAAWLGGPKGKRQGDQGLWLEGSVALSRGWIRSLARRPRGAALLRSRFS
jgi:FMN phosphatase YigB (HAD superfamily)